MLRKTLIALMAIAALGMGSTAMAMHGGGGGFGGGGGWHGGGGGWHGGGWHGGGWHASASTAIPSHVTPSSYITAISFRTATSRSSDTVISSVLDSMPPLLAGLGCLRVTAGTESGYAAGPISEDARRGAAEHTARRAEERGRRCPRYVR